ncbi:hypothetical protein CUC00_06575 [Prevotella intermedia]|nr:hypothetical protein CTM44_03375 [Prevotella intermedia]ATV40722.1 hypothetical protein CUC00_06575 [Prevotella intermedia]
MVLSVYVNRKQWKDKSYGTKEKPMPVFLHRIISGDDIEERNKNALRKDTRVRVKNVLLKVGNLVSFL